MDGRCEVAIIYRLYHYRWSKWGVENSEIFFCLNGLCTVEAIFLRNMIEKLQIK